MPDVPPTPLYGGRMSEELKCPKCGHAVPATGISSSYGAGDPPTFSAKREHTKCPECGTALVRVQESGGWTVD